MAILKVLFGKDGELGSLYWSISALDETASKLEGLADGHALTEGRVVEGLREEDDCYVSYLVARLNTDHMPSASLQESLPGKL